MKLSTIKKYTGIFEKVLASNMSLNKYCKIHNDCNYATITKTIYQLKKQGDVEGEELRNMIDLYNKIVTKADFIPNTVVCTQEVVDTDDAAELKIHRNSEGKIVNYEITAYIKDSAPFYCNLNRQECELIFGLYTYYGGNITARNVANEFARFTLPEVKRIFRVFKLTKDSFWAPPHLVEELSEEDLNSYRMRLKERAAFKYADSQQERDFKKTLNKFANKINKLEDRKEFIKTLHSEGVLLKEYDVPPKNDLQSNTFVLYLSDLHIGAYNEKYGYIRLENYDEDEILRRLYKVFDYLKNKSYSKIIVLNLGDSVDGYNKQTTRGGHELPGILSNKEEAQLYLSVMTNFFYNLKKYCSNIEYYCIGESNHDGDWGWINNLLLSSKLESLNIKSYISPNPIDSIDVNDVSIIFLHGKDISNQFKGFPLVLNDKTEKWFMNYLIDSGKSWKSRICIAKGDLHQPAFTSCSSFDYISCPSLYGSSQYIVANFGKTRWGIAYMEIDEYNNINNGLIRD